jgi:hypothetical protein
VGHPVLAVEEPVGGGEDEQRPLELPGLRKRGDDPLDALVEREQRPQLAAVAAGDLGDLGLAQQRQIADPGRLVGDVGLVEVRRPRQRLVAEGPAVADRGLDRDQIRPRRVRAVVWRVRATCSASNWARGRSPSCRPLFSPFVQAAFTGQT